MELEFIAINGEKKELKCILNQSTREVRIFHENHLLYNLGIDQITIEILENLHFKILINAENDQHSCLCLEGSSTKQEKLKEFCQNLLNLQEIHTIYDKEERTIETTDFETKEETVNIPQLRSILNKYERYTIYEAVDKLFIIGSDRHYTKYRLLTLDRTIENPETLDEILVEDPCEWHHINEIVEHLNIGTYSTILRTIYAVGIVGFVRFLKGYYMIVITQREKIGCIHGRFVYRIAATQQLSIYHDPRSIANNGIWNWMQKCLYSSPVDEAEARYLGLFHFIDLCKDFYYSPSYDLTNTLQHNMVTVNLSPNDMFIWNHYLTSEWSNCLSFSAKHAFIQPILYGAYEQRKCSLFGRVISISLIARRSRHYAGTRYLKRGISDEGWVANEVETEQLVEDESMSTPSFSSFIQLRGSIPIFWSQETSVTVPKPPIVLNRIDLTYKATQLHFANLFERYGCPVIVMNLIKHNEKKEREVIVGREFHNALDYINQFVPSPNKVQYIAFDYSKASKQKHNNGSFGVIQYMNCLSEWSLKGTGFFANAPRRFLKHGHLMEETLSDSIYGHKRKSPPRNVKSKRHIRWYEQRGIVRVNCIDCLDRTNVVQFNCGYCALKQQLYTMDVLPNGSNGEEGMGSETGECQLQLMRILMHLYSLTGDAVSMQYGGSEAQKNVKSGAGQDVKNHRAILTSIRRYYSNSFTDTAKQDAINVFLGFFIPRNHSVPLWELESDYYLHNIGVQQGTMSYRRRTESAVQLPDRALYQLPQSTETLDNIEKPGEMSLERYQELCQMRKKRREEILNTVQSHYDWWKTSLERYEKMFSKNGRNRRMHESSEEELDAFMQIYHPKEITSFDKCLSYSFMEPMDLSKDMTEIIKDRDENKLEEQANTFSLPYWLKTTDIAKGKMEEEKPAEQQQEGLQCHVGGRYERQFQTNSPSPMNHKLTFIEKLEAQCQDEIYESYVESIKNREIWLKEENTAHRASFLSYLREFYIDSSDVRAVKETQQRSGATYKIQGGIYAGLDQKMIARELVLRTLTVDKDEENFYKDVVGIAKHFDSNAQLVIPKDRMELYASFFESTNIDTEENQSCFFQPTLSPKASFNESLTIRHENHLQRDPSISLVGVLYRHANAGQEFILFNEAAHEHEFIDAFKPNETYVR